MDYLVTFLSTLARFRFTVGWAATKVDSPVSYIQAKQCLVHQGPVRACLCPL